MVVNFRYVRAEMIYRLHGAILLSKFTAAAVFFPISVQSNAHPVCTVFGDIDRL